MHLTHFIKQFIAAAATPLVCALLTACLGVGARLLGRLRISAALWIGAASLVYLAAVAPVADALLGPLERRFPPLKDVQALHTVSFIVVLGGGYGPRDGNPITAALDEDALARIAEGIRLMRQVQGAHLVVSGGASETGRIPSAIGYAEFAVDLGVEPGSIVKLDRSMDTAEEASSVATLVGNSPFILVTSAYHMPRAVRLMQLAGAHPIPAPTGQRVPRQSEFGARAWLPTSLALRNTERALHEYMGLAIVK